MKISTWAAENWQFLTILGGLIITNLHYKIDIEVLKVKIGHVKEDIKNLRQQFFNNERTDP